MPGRRFGKTYRAAYKPLVRVRRLLCLLSIFCVCCLPMACCSGAMCRSYAPHPSASNRVIPNGSSRVCSCRKTASCRTSRAFSTSALHQPPRHKKALPGQREQEGHLCRRSLFTSVASNNSGVSRAGAALCLGDSLCHATQEAHGPIQSYSTIDTSITGGTRTSVAPRLINSHSRSSTCASFPHRTTASIMRSLHVLVATSAKPAPLNMR